eukprot:3906533-Rhodomonas_salina.2
MEGPTCEDVGHVVQEHRAVRVEHPVRHTLTISPSPRKNISDCAFCLTASASDGFDSVHLGSGWIRSDRRKDGTHRPRP